MHFTRTTFVFTVLSKDPIPGGVRMRDVLAECEEGDYVLAEPSGRTRVETLNENEIKQALVEAGCEPEFFVWTETRPRAPESPDIPF